MVYCNIADVTKVNSASFKSTHFYTGEVENNKLVKCTPFDLDRGDIIHFRPLTMVTGVHQSKGTLAVVNAVDPDGTVHLENAVINMKQLKEINKLHVSGKF